MVGHRDLFRGRRGFFLAALLLTEFGGAVQGLAYSTVLPVVAAELRGFALFGATLAAGQIAAVLMLSVAGGVLDRVRPGRVLLVATVGYLVGTAMAVAAPAMVWVLAGTVVRGLAAGLLAGFVMTAIGTMFDDVERPKVFGLYAVVWLVPSVVGPPLNALVTSWLGWRVALAWPAVLVLTGRIALGRFVSEMPWQRRDTAVQPGAGLVVCGGLALAAIGSAVGGALGLAVLVAGSAVAAWAGVALLRRSAGGSRRLRVLLTFTLLCAGFFGLYELLSATIVEGLGAPLGWAAVALTGGLLAWSLVGLRPRPGARPDRGVVGTLLVLTGLLLALAALWLGTGAVAAGGVVLAAVVAGSGMGAAYPVLSSEPFSPTVRAPRERTEPDDTPVGALIAFAETAGTAWAVLLAGGVYSLARTAGTTALASSVAAYAVLVLVCAAGVVAAARRRPDRRDDVAAPQRAAESRDRPG